MTPVNIIEFLKTKTDIAPDKYDGSYELVQKTVEMLAKQEVKNFGVQDLEMLYFMTINTRKSSFENKKKRVEVSHLPEEDKKVLKQLIDAIRINAENGIYIFGENRTVGMFGTAFAKFSASDEAARIFLEMCIKIAQEKNEDELFPIADKYLQNDLKGIGIASVSQVLHCLKPLIFPVMNGAVSEMSKKYMAIKYPNKINQFATNAKIIKEFRDKNFPFKNFIVLDRALCELNKKEEESAMQENSETLIDDMEPENIPLNLIIYGPPGTGKTYQLMKKYFPRFTDGDGSKRYKFITFHQSYSYEEFIEGIRPVTNDKGEVSYKVVDGIFKEIVEKARNDPDSDYAIFIDEINRGNISKIFGELITLLEDDKRIGGENSLTVTLPYSKEDFGIPTNLHIIGTMNTADRSIALIDVALRRRFEFEALYPNYDLPKLKFKDLLRKLNDQIIEKIGPECQIGHSYFLEGNGTFDLGKIMNNKVIPLLQEYFYNEMSTIEEMLKNCGVGIDEDSKKRGMIKFKKLIQEPNE